MKGKTERTPVDLHDETMIGSVARPMGIVEELRRLVHRSQKYEMTRDNAYYQFRNAAFHCGKLMSFFWHKYQQVRRKETETE